jgi:DNA-binding NtrC family response regulator
MHKPVHLTLTPAERNFFSLVDQAVKANPFGSKRVRTDLKIAGLFPGVSDTDRLHKTLAEVRKHIQVLEATKRLDLARYQGRDRIVLENALLFDIFHRYSDRFDALIDDQIAAGATSLPVDFAPKVLSELEQLGLSADQSRRYLALCYQFRRAFFFIEMNLVGRSPCMQRLRKSLWNNVFTFDVDLYNRFLVDRMEDFSTLILGETGTGKGTAAAAIGRSGFIPFDSANNRFEESFAAGFVALNLSQFPEALIESELFGHRKGAFTGAVDNYKGIFDRCSSHGSIFLDEIGEVSESIQIKLLQVIQERTFTPVGSHRPHRFSGRVIAATNRSLEKLHRENSLRDDFFYRLCSDIITIPPLSQRIQEDKGELEDLLAHTTARILGRPSKEVTTMLKAELTRQPGLDYRWPGNVRELEQAVRRVLINKSYQGIADSAPRDICTQLVKGLEAGSLDAAGLVNGYCHLLHQRHKTFQAVARRTGLDRRTVKKYIQAGAQEFGEGQ